MRSYSHQYYDFKPALVMAPTVRNQQHQGLNMENIPKIVLLFTLHILVVIGGVKTISTRWERLPEDLADREACDGVKQHRRNAHLYATAA